MGQGLLYGIGGGGRVCFGILAEFGGLLRIRSGVEAHFGPRANAVARRAGLSANVEVLFQRVAGGGGH